MSELHESFEIEEHEGALKLAQDRICKAPIVPVVVFEGFESPPYVAHVYLQDDLEHQAADVWAGTVWRDDRWPTVEEITAALVRWRGQDAPTFNVHWWSGHEPT